MTFPPRGTPAVLIAAGALVLASTGGAVAGSLITGAQIKNGTITSADIRNHSLQSKDLSGGARASLQGDQGVAGLDGAPGVDGADGAPGIDGVDGSRGSPGYPGAPGPSGSPGAQGSAGPEGLSGYYSTWNSALVPANSNGQVSMACDAGFVLVGATAYMVDGYQGPAINTDELTAIAYVANPTASDDTMYLRIYCITAPPPA